MAKSTGKKSKPSKPSTKVSSKALPEETPFRPKGGK